MLTKEGPGRYKHKNDDTYRIELEVEGTGKRVVPVLGDKKINVPGTVTAEQYGTFKPEYQLSIIFTFLKDSSDKAKYTLTFVDSADNVVDKRVINRPAGSMLPRDIHRVFIFRVTGG